MVKAKIIDARTYPNAVFGSQKTIQGLEKDLARNNLSDIASIDGPFSLATERNDEIVILRNSPGIPLYVISDRTTLYVANTIKRLHDVTGSFRYNDVRIVPSAHTIRFNGKELSFQRYRDELPTTQVDMSLDEIGYQLREELTTAVKRMAEHDRGKNVAVLLSGGIDSAAVATILRENREGVVGYTLDVGGKDLVNAQIVAERLKIPLKKVPIDRDELISSLSKYIEIAEEYRPFVIDNVPGFYFLGRAAAHDGIEVLFTGSAANEMFGDYYPSSDYDVPVEQNAKQAQRKLLIEGRKPADPLYNKVLGSGLDRYGFIKSLMEFGIESREPWGASNVLQFGIQIPERILLRENRHRKPDIARIAFPEIGTYPEKERMADGSGISQSFTTDYRTNREIFEKLFNVNERRHNQYLLAMERTFTCGGKTKKK